jgi:serine/threonine protein kinase
MTASDNTCDDGRSCRADFTFLQELGRGSWGTVHVARRRQDGQLYAIKAVMLASLSRKDQLAAVAEAQVGGRASVGMHAAVAAAGPFLAAPLPACRRVHSLPWTSAVRVSTTAGLTAASE